MGKDEMEDEMRSGKFETDDARIYYEVHGSGRPIVLLHGNGESHKIFEKYAIWFEKRGFQVILMDSRGHGHSLLKRTSSLEFTTQDMAGDVLKLLCHLGIDQVTLLGFSDGANIALEFASLYPKQTTEVIAVSGNAKPWGMLLPYYLFVGAEYAVAGIMREFCQDKRQRQKFDRSRMLNGLMFHSPDLTEERLGKIQAPTLLIAGTNDVIRVSHSQWMLRQIPGSRLVLLKKARHVDFLHKRERYLRVIERFLKEEEGTVIRQNNIRQDTGKSEAKAV